MNSDIKEQLDYIKELLEKDYTPREQEELITVMSKFTKAIQDIDNCEIK